VPFSLAAFRTGFVGLWMDRQAGVLAYAPLYWVVPACWLLAWRRMWPFLVPAALLYLPAAAFTHGWWAGFSPAARYLVPMMPFCVAAMAHALRHRAVRVALAVLLVPQAVIDAVIWQRPRSLWPADTGNAALQMLGGIGRAYEALLPAAQAGRSIGQGLLLLGLVSAGLVAVVIFGQPPRAGRERGAGRPGREAPSAADTTWADGSASRRGS
jgi:hypothetical protein